jgi:serine/threonine protein kinase
VVRFHESGLSANGAVFWIIMEKVDGLTLREVLKSSGPLDQAEAIKVRRTLQTFMVSRRLKRRVAVALTRRGLG